MGQDTTAEICAGVLSVLLTQSHSQWSVLGIWGSWPTSVAYNFSEHLGTVCTTKHCKTHEPSL